jgi:uncharacterized protein YbbC (DUF1343 family)
LSPLAVRSFTQPVPVGEKLFRSRGWDVDTGFTAQRGDLFPPHDGFGHTGFTGTSLWVDIPSETVVIVLTSRLHPNEKGNATPLRRQIGTLAAAAFAPNTPRQQTNDIIPSSRQRPPVLCGIDVLAREQFARLKGQRVGLVTNHTGRTADGTSTIDAIFNAPDVKLTALFSPEHGIRGEKDEKIGDGVDAKTKLPIYSLYGERRQPTAEQLKNVDVLIFDIQDIGCRFYTYISTLGLLLEIAAKEGKRVVVLDRPNPLGGVHVRGPVRDPNRESFIAYHDLPLQHGMTVGEIAKLFVLERKHDVKLDIIPCENWRRADTWDATGRAWVNPSPNMRSLYAAILYPGVGILETTNLSVGRGTDRPFEWIGAPWLDGRKLAAEFNARGVAGVMAVPAERTPVSSVHANKLCGGVDLVIRNRDEVDGVRVGLELASALKATHSEAWDPKNYDRLLVHAKTADALLAGKPFAQYSASWPPELSRFMVRRQKALLYLE